MRVPRARALPKYQRAREVSLCAAKQGRGRERESVDSSIIVRMFERPNDDSTRYSRSAWLSARPNLSSVRCAQAPTYVP